MPISESVTTIFRKRVDIIENESHSLFRLEFTESPYRHI